MKHQIIITSTTNKTFKWLRSLALKKNRDEEAVFVIEGYRDVLAALEANWVLHTIASVPAAAEQVAGITVPFRLQIAPDVMKYLANRDNAQPVMGVFMQQWAEPERMGKGLWLGLEDIRDPGNLGTIIRTADAVSAAGIVLIGNPCDPFSPECVRATMGSLPRVKMVRMTRERFAAWRRDYKGQVLGTHLSGAVDYRKADYSNESSIILMGSETGGLSETLAMLCDARVRIPMTGKTESLNVGVASALMLYEARRGQL